VEWDYDVGCVGGCMGWEGVKTKRKTTTTGLLRVNKGIKT